MRFVGFSIPKAEVGAPAKFVCQSPNIFVDAYLVTEYPEHGCKFRVQWTFYTLQLAWFQLIPWWNVGVVFRLCTCCGLGRNSKCLCRMTFLGTLTVTICIHLAYFVCNIQHIKMEENLAVTWNILRNVTQTVLCSYTYTDHLKNEAKLSLFDFSTDVQ